MKTLSRWRATSALYLGRRLFKSQNDLFERFEAIHFVERPDFQGLKNWGQRLRASEFQGVVEATQSSFRRLHLGQYFLQQCRVSNVAGFPDACNRLQQPAIEALAQGFFQCFDLANKNSGISPASLLGSVASGIVRRRHWFG